MKTNLIFLILILLVINLPAQQYKVVEKVQLTFASEGEFYFPQITGQGNTVAFSGPNFTGLYLYDLNTDKKTLITEDPGAGYNPVFINDGQQVVYRTYQYKGPRRYSSLVSLNLITKEKKYIEQEQRDLSIPLMANPSTVGYVNNGQLKSFHAASFNTNSAPVSEKPLVIIENRSIVLYGNQSRKVLKPLGDGIYIWPLISPDGTKLLFTLAGRGTYISDLNGNIIIDLGVADAPQWSPDGEWIAFMDDKDDGDNYTASDIYITKIDGTSRTALTNTSDEIEMYPAWGTDNNKLVCATNRGEIFLLKLSTE